MTGEYMLWTLEPQRILHIFKPYRKDCHDKLSPDEPPITILFASSDGHWLAAVNCFGDAYVYNHETQRQHWFISRLDGAAVTAVGFSPAIKNALILTTSSNQVYVFDVETKQLGGWSTRNSFTLPKRFQEFPGEVIGLSFPPSSSSSLVVMYSSRSMCVIDFGLPVVEDLASRKLQRTPPGKLKRSFKECSELLVSNKLLSSTRKKCEFFAVRDPVLFIGSLSKGSVMIVDRPWMEVVKTMEAEFFNMSFFNMPLFRHIFGHELLQHDTYSRVQFTDFVPFVSPYI